MERSGTGMLALWAASAVAAGASFAAARDGARSGRRSDEVAPPAHAAAATANATTSTSAPASTIGPPAPAPLRVVLDPGHGGSNLGAPSLRPGLSEKHLTLALAFDLRRELERRGAEVFLTRDRDVFLSLRERVRRANHLGADVFVSLHLNATEDHAQRGFETWMDPRALDTDSRVLRVADGPPRATAAELAPLLDDLERGAAVPLAAELAERVQRSVATLRGDALDRGVKQGSQDVLLGATMPAILVELGFVDHPVEGVELLDRDLRAALARAVADAITAGDS